MVVADSRGRDDPTVRTRSLLTIRESCYCRFRILNAHESPLKVKCCSVVRMKRAKPSAHRSAARVGEAPRNIDEYLAGIPEPSRSTLNKIRAAISSAVPPEATETISYRIPAFKYKGILVWFGAFSDHCSLFPTASIVEAFKNELKGYSISKSTIHFPVDQPLPAALVKKIVKARVAQNEKKRPG